MCAQRRPEVKLRQHAPLWLMIMPSSPFAQRRPEVELRQHSAIPYRTAEGQARSTKAGGKTPATPASRLRFRTDPNPLNEDRRRNSGNTQPGGAFMAPLDSRSTKAGGGTPATQTPFCRFSSGLQSLNEGRKWDSDNTIRAAEGQPSNFPAQQRPEAKLRQHVLTHVELLLVAERSTKAGSGTPATLLISKISARPHDSGLESALLQNDEGQICPFQAMVLLQSRLLYSIRISDP